MLKGIGYDGCSVGAQTCGSKGGYDIMSAPISQVGLNELFPTLKALEKEGADEDFVRWARMHENAKSIMNLYRGTPSNAPASDAAVLATVRVPDLSAEELIVRIAHELGLTRLDQGWKGWDFMEDERGKTYEFIMNSGHSAVWHREHFPSGFMGNTAAFLAWLLQNPREYFHGTVPEEARMPGKDKYNRRAIAYLGHEAIPESTYFREKRVERDLRFISANSSRWDMVNYLAFREIKS